MQFLVSPRTDGSRVVASLRATILSKVLLSLIFSTLGSHIAQVTADTFEWSGYRWKIRDSNGNTQGPGPNLFAASKVNVYVDDAGRLHLKIVKNKDGQWTCAEVSSVESFGYGTYQWQLSSNYDRLAKNVVLGLFTYNSPANVAKQLGTKIGDGKADTAHEIDIEFTKVWGPANLFFTTHDPDVKSPGFQCYDQPKSDASTHRFVWSPKRIHWESFHDHVGNESPRDKLIVDQRKGPTEGEPAMQDYEGPVIPKDLDERVHMNLWIFDQESKIKVPTDGEQQEVIIHNFKYSPLPTAEK